MSTLAAAAAVATGAGATAIAPLQVTPEVMRRWFRSPLAFAQEAVRFAPDEWQRDVLELIRVSPKVGLRIALMACKGPGKSALLAVIILWYLFTRPHCRIICTSITGRNLKDGLWAELALWGAPLKGIFDFGGERIAHREHAETWFCSARSWAQDADKSKQADTLAGVHARFNLFVLDEVSEYPEGVVAAAEGAMSTGDETILLCAGNCTRTVGSPLYRMATKDRISESNPRGFHVVRITGDPDDAKRSPRVDIEWARKLVRDWGRDHNIVRTNVLAEFPKQGSDKLLSLEDLARAMERDVKLPAYQDAAKVIGIDVARFGDDKTIKFPRQGLVGFQPRTYTYENRSFMGQARNAVEMAHGWGADAVFVEVNGLGAGLWDCIQQLDQTDRFIAVNVCATEGVDPRFENLRAQMQWETAEWIRSGASLPEIPELIAEATAISYDVSKRSGKLIIAPKEELKELIGHSPDYWDALCLTHAAPVVSRFAREPINRPILTAPGARPAWDYNPFSRRSA